MSGTSPSTPCVSRCLLTMASNLLAVLGYLTQRKPRSAQQRSHRTPKNRGTANSTLALATVSPAHGQKPCNMDSSLLVVVPGIPIHLNFSILVIAYGSRRRAMVSWELVEP